MPNAGLTVLCVDEPESADLVATRLEQHGENVSAHTATSGTDGLEALDSGAFDAVVSGYDLPGMDGIEFLEAVRADRPDFPFVLFADRGSEAVASRAIAAGVTDYVRRGDDEQFRSLARRVAIAIERHRERAATADARERAERVLEAAPDAILVSVDGEVVYANASAATLFSATDEDDLLGRDAASLADEAVDDGAGDDASVASVQQSETGVTHGRRQLRRLDGETFAAEVTGRSVTWGGEPGVVAVVRDLTDRERRERTEERYRGAFEEAMDAMVVADDDGEYVDANRSACELFGLPREQLLGRNVADFAPEDYDFDSEWEAFRTEDTDCGTFPLVRPDGERRIVEYAATADVAPGEHLSVLRDVTRRERLEDERQAERDALREMHQVVADRDTDLETKVRRLLELGQEFLDVPYAFLTEIEDGTQRIVQSLGDHELLRAGETCPLSEAYCRRTVTRDELVSIQNAVAEGFDADPAYERFELGCYIGAKVVVDDDLYGTFCFAGTEPRTRPFSEIERTFVELLARLVSYELEQRRAIEDLERQNERLDEFASMVSHDLRNPLAVAEGYLELVREDHNDEHFDRIETAHDRMDRLIEDLLYLAREGKELDDIEVVSLPEAVRASWEIVSGDRGEATLHLDDDLGDVRADYDRLCQLLENVFRNAVEHGSTSPDSHARQDAVEHGSTSPPSQTSKDAVEHGSTSPDSQARQDAPEHAGPAVTVRVEALADGFAVADDGPGIPEDLREDVFERGYSTRESGSGFGLYIVGRIAEAHGWDVTVIESEDGGARFEFTGVEPV